jgi:hypothetical protein
MLHEGASTIGPGSTTFLFGIPTSFSDVQYGLQSHSLQEFRNASPRPLLTGTRVALTPPGHDKANVDKARVDPSIRSRPPTSVCVQRRMDYQPMDVFCTSSSLEGGFRLGLRLTTRTSSQTRFVHARACLVRRGTIIVPICSSVSRTLRAYVTRTTNKIRIPEAPE